ncbi:MAG: ATP synthase F1 subunit epsilon [Candidatus Nephthysia bennettiae]|uniref:ATP synthase epsilon chain n=1 Tax=Candidatus Nephthysia bennettiae TaxID=3127016 RepID=A0A934N5B2_9BACT|nr:ATP synthase F1 subunit epsilon [Candidatus Dormibacteraeota bacterium]MBJ7614992.1 ATP synthase F1 subunit epsilon [Candidatus Dormibacteraeota bacterium]PZR88292.1 MAG: ATP synthase F1 subunit epsilon [Candidatus Dormibacteraeota bacterium]
MGVQVRVVSVERSLFEGEVDGQGRPFLVCEGVEGELGILPRHAPLLTTLRPGLVSIRNGSEETELFVGGGFLEVLPDRVTILADVAERAEEISEESAEEVRRQAQERLAARELTAAEERELETVLAIAEARLRLARALRGRG